jgi:hypothetical protein
MQAHDLRRDGGRICHFTPFFIFARFFLTTTPKNEDHWKKKKKVGGSGKKRDFLTSHHFFDKQVLRAMTSTKMMMMMMLLFGTAVVLTAVSCRTSAFLLPQSRLSKTSLRYSNYNSGGRVSDPSSFFWGEYDAATPRERDPVASAYGSLSKVGEMFPARNLSPAWKNPTSYRSDGNKNAFSTLSGLAGTSNGIAMVTGMMSNDAAMTNSNSIPQSNGRSVDQFLAQNRNAVPYSDTNGNAMSSNMASSAGFVPQQYQYKDFNTLDNGRRSAVTTNMGFQDPSRAARLNTDGSMGGSIKTGFAVAAAARNNGFMPPSRPTVASVAPDATDMERGNSRIGLFGNEPGSGLMPTQPSNSYGASQSLFGSSPSSDDFFFAPPPSPQLQQQPGRRLAAATSIHNNNNNYYYNNPPIDLTRRYDGKVDNFVFEQPNLHDQPNGMTAAQPRPSFQRTGGSGSGSSTYISYDDKPSGFTRSSSSSSNDNYNIRPQYYDKYNRSPQQLKTSNNNNNNNNMASNTYPPSHNSPPAFYQSHDDYPSQSHGQQQQQQQQHAFRSHRYQNQYHQQRSQHSTSPDGSSSTRSVPSRPSHQTNPASAHFTPSSPKRRYGIDNVHRTTTNPMGEWKDRLWKGTSEAVEKMISNRAKYNGVWDGGFL